MIRFLKHKILKLILLIGDLIKRMMIRNQLLRLENKNQKICASISAWNFIELSLLKQLSKNKKKNREVRKSKRKNNKNKMDLLFINSKFNAFQMRKRLEENNNKRNYKMNRKLWKRNKNNNNKNRRNKKKRNRKNKSNHQ